MLRKLSRIFGVVSVILTILPWLFLAVGLLAIPAEDTYDYENWEPGDPHPESLAWARAAGWYGVICTALSAPGLAGSLLPYRKYKRGGGMMLASGIIMALLAFPWYLKFAPILLAVAGALTRSAGDRLPEIDDTADKEEHLEE